MKTLILLGVFVFLCLSSYNTMAQAGHVCSITYKTCQKNSTCYKTESYMVWFKRKYRLVHNPCTTSYLCSCNVCCRGYYGPNCEHEM